MSGAESHQIQQQQNKYAIRSVTQQCRLVFQECTHLETNTHANTAITQKRTSHLEEYYEVLQDIKDKTIQGKPRLRSKSEKELVSSFPRKPHAPKIPKDEGAVDSFIKSHWAENRLSDFNLWDAGVGASSSTSNSLDFRLHSDRTATNVVLTSLKTLHTWIILYRDLSYKAKDTPASASPPIKASRESPEPQDANTSPEGDIDVAEARASVEKLLHNLVKLGVAIRQASATSRTSNADRTLHKFEKDYAPLMDHLSFLLRLSNPVIAERTSHHMGSSDGINMHLPLRPEQQILINANVKRRHRFQYAKRRRFRLGFAVEETDLLREVSSPKVASEPSTSQMLVGKTTKNTKPHEPTTTTPKPSSVTLSRNSTVNTNQASDFVSGTPLHKIVVEESVAAPPTAIALKSDYPKPPRLVQGSTSFTCPYCFLTLPKFRLQTRHWKKHVSEDLQPYTCYLSNCPQKNCLFNTFKSWKAHVVTEHKVSHGWSCLFCDTLKFDEEAHLRHHILAIHKGEVDEEYLNDLVESCQVVDRPHLDRCPVCSTCEDSWRLGNEVSSLDEPGTGAFLGHIGECIHAFALRALPDDESEVSGDETSTGVTGMSHQMSRSDLSVTLSNSSNYEGEGILTSSALFGIAQMARREAVERFLNDVSTLHSDAEEPIGTFPESQVEDTGWIETTSSPTSSKETSPLLQQSAVPAPPATPNPATDSGALPHSSPAGINEDTSLLPGNVDEIDILTMPRDTAMALVLHFVDAITAIASDVAAPSPESKSDFQSRSFDLPYKASSDASQQDAQEQDKVNQDEKGIPEEVVDTTVSDLDRRNMTRRFFSKSIPPVGLKEYLDRIQKYSPLSTSVWLAAGIYMYKICILYKYVPLTKRTMHRLVLACVVVAMKALEDHRWPQKRLAAVGGVTEEALGKLELCILFLLSFDLQFFSLGQLESWIALIRQTTKTATMEFFIGEHEQPLDQLRAPPVV